MRSTRPYNRSGPASLAFAIALFAAACTADSPGTDATTETPPADTMTDAGTTNGADADTSDGRVIENGATPANGVDAGALGNDAALLLPIDEAVEDATLLSFRMRMLEAIGARDTTFLFAHMSDGIRISFGAGGGKEGFREMWNPSSSDSEVWRVLGGILGGGGRYYDDSFQLPDGSTAAARFVAPYYFAVYPGEEFDSFLHGVIIAPNVLVHDQPGSSATVVDTLSFAIVGVTDFTPREGPGGMWIHIETPGGLSGYVAESLIRSPVGYRAIFHRVGTTWEMSALVAGD